MTNATIIFVVGESETTDAVTSLHTKTFKTSGTLKKSSTANFYKRHVN